MQTVEIRYQDRGLAQPMAQMRTWLDDHRAKPTLVEIAFLPSKQLCFRLTFHDGDEAVAFAQEFDGRVR